jgi:thiol-disulfide isomerase/thioredoxin
MRAVVGLIAILFFAAAAFGDDADGPWEIRGRVVDAEGKPVDDFVAATFWSANGKLWDERGEPIKIRGAAEWDKFWKDEGAMVAMPKRLAKRTSEGRFTVTVENRPRVSIFVTDAKQRRGGYVSVPKSAAPKEVEIKLVPLVRVHGKIYCPEAKRTPDWTAAVVHPPLDTSNYLHFTHCGSLKGEFSFLLPPGPYDFDVYSSSPDASVPRKGVLAHLPPCVRGIRVDVPAGAAELDLGTLDVELPARAGGIKGDYSFYYGKEPPQLQFTDARGVARDFKLAQLRGKWVLLEFWTLWCGPCIAEALPNLAKFYAEHEKDRGRFEILAICVTADKETTTIDAYDRAVAPVVKEQWNGQPLPFPVLIDGEGKTSAIYGIGSYPTTLLVDPQGRLVKFGDQVMLEDRLAEPGR